MFCIGDCKHGRKDEGDMIRCCLCAAWFHEECLGLQPHDRGVFPCLSCRNINSRVDELGQHVKMLMDMVNNVTKLLHTTHTKYEEEKVKMVEDQAVLVKENN